MTFDLQTFGAEIRLENIYVPMQFQGHGAKVKVMTAKNGCTQVCAPLGHSLSFVAMDGWMDG